MDQNHPVQRKREATGKDNRTEHRPIKQMTPALKQTSPSPSRKFGREDIKIKYSKPIHHSFEELIEDLFSNNDFPCGGTCYKCGDPRDINCEIFCARCFLEEDEEEASDDNRHEHEDVDFWGNDFDRD